MQLPDSLQVSQIQSFDPPKRKLMGPGPSDIHPRVSTALSRHCIGHLDPEFVKVMDEIKQMTQYVFQTTNKLTMVISAPGSAGMEACFVNLVEPGDKVIVCINGVFGGRMKENVERCGGTVVEVHNEWGRPVDPDQLEIQLKAHPDAKIVAFVHAETSTGVRSDAETLCQLAKQYGCLTIVDTVTSLAGIPVLVDNWGIDAIYSGSQKCLSCTPGLSPISFSKKAVKKIKNRKTKVQSWFLDMNLVMKYWGNESNKRSYHHTAPVNALYAMHEALLMVREEGLDSIWERHQNMHEKLRDGLLELGFSYVVEEKYRLPQLNAVYLPEGWDEASVRKKLLNDYMLEVGGGLGILAGRIWRIGLMGYSAQEKNVNYCLDSIRQIFKG